MVPVVSFDVQTLSKLKKRRPKQMPGPSSQLILHSRKCHSYRWTWITGRRTSPVTITRDIPATCWNPWIPCRGVWTSMSSVKKNSVENVLWSIAELPRLGGGCQQLRNSEQCCSSWKPHVCYNTSYTVVHTVRSIQALQSGQLLTRSINKTTDTSPRTSV